jgi:hypothetical protein
MFTPLDAYRFSQGINDRVATRREVIGVAVERAEAGERSGSPAGKPLSAR